MGQYYHAVLKDKEGKTKAYYNYGLKLMEHSYFENRFVNYVCKKLLNNPMNVAWVGDYAETNDYPEEKHIFIEKRDYRARQVESKDNFNTLGLYMINETKKEFVDMSFYFVINARHMKDYDEWVIHPLSLLTAMGNGLGGGDYRGINEELVGSWSGDLIQFVDMCNLYKNDNKKYIEIEEQYLDITKNLIFQE